jgi:maltokinase
VDVVTQVGDRLLHLVLGVRRPGEEAHLLRAGDDPVLGLLEDAEGLGVVVDALRDTELARLVLESVHGGGGAVDPGPPAPVSDDDDGAVLAFGEDCTLTVFSWLPHGPHPGVELLVALDEVGFNHLAAPLALWRRGGRDLGLVQEGLAGSAGGWALALTSLRDLYAAGGPPEAAGGDFAPEARALGTMTARMHLAMDRAFGRRSGEIRHWAEVVEGVVRTSEPSLLDGEGVHEALEMLKASGLKASTLRTHGDFHLGRTARTNQGWVVADFMPGGIPPGSDAPVFRSPLADVADMLWSLHHVASVAALERDPTGRSGLAGLAQAWEARNRRAFLTGYLATPGIGGLVPSDRRIVRGLAAVFEAERGALRSGGSQAAS